VDRCLGLVASKSSSLSNGSSLRDVDHADGFLRGHLSGDFPRSQSVGHDEFSEGLCNVLAPTFWIDLSLASGHL